MKLAISLTCMALAAMLLSSACTGGAAPASVQSTNSQITEGVMTTSVDDGSKPTGGIMTSFPVSTPVIYVSFKVSGVAQDDMIKATWIYVGGAAADKANTQINETYDIVQVPEASYYLAFYLDKPVEGWDKGDYKVVLSVNSKEKLSVPFKME
ncbi:MAG: hypothetical protein NTZ34_12395 [Chloroflexi bacterium]|nr:hypothetical protein [Chloroflexota bacterium]